MIENSFDYVMIILMWIGGIGLGYLLRLFAENKQEVQNKGK